MDTPPRTPAEVAVRNRAAWDLQVEKGNPWTVPVSPEIVAAARRGEWSVVLTPTKPVPRDWFGDLRGARVLGLASGGGQQGPVLAAAGARVTVLDNSPRQLDRDREVAEREGLDLRLELGDMADLSRFPDGAFDLVFHPVSNVFVADVFPVWREAYRVLRPGGRLLAGFCHPILFLVDEDLKPGEPAVLRGAVPYSDLTARSPEEIARRLETGEPLQFGHGLDAQIGGQLEAGFALTGFYEDRLPGDPLDPHFPLCLATRAEKLTPR
jgi:SAM-dependent methyltransferase